MPDDETRGTGSSSSSSPISSGSPRSALVRLATLEGLVDALIIKYRNLRGQHDLLVNKYCALEKRYCALEGKGEKEKEVEKNVTETTSAPPSPAPPYWY